MTQNFAVLPLRNAVLFPGSRPTFQIGRVRSRALLETLAPGDVLAVFTQRDPTQIEVDRADLHSVGSLARVTAIDPHDDGNYSVGLEGTKRIRLESVTALDPHLAADVTVLDDANADAPEAAALATALAEALRGVTDRLDGETPARFADRVAGSLEIPLEEKVAVLAEADVPARLRILAEHAADESRDEAEAEADGAGSKKERVLHTRVPAVLERELKRLAESLRVPVSNLVRAVLEDAVAVADAAGEGVEQRLKRFAKNLEEERDRLKRRVQRDPIGDVFAFQPVKLAIAASCAKCEKELKRGTTANLGLTEKPRPANERVFVCDDCLPAD